MFNIMYHIMFNTMYEIIKIKTKKTTKIKTKNRKQKIMNLYNEDIFII